MTCAREKKIAFPTGVANLVASVNTRVKSIMRRRNRGAARARLDLESVGPLGLGGLGGLTMLAPEASELVAAVLQRSQAAVAALDAQDPERPNFEAFVQVLLPRIGPDVAPAVCWQSACAI